MEIELPESFRKLTGAFYDGFYDHTPNFRDVVRKTLRRFSAEEKNELHQFLAIIMTEEYSTEDRRLIWNRGRSSYYIISPAGNEFFYMIVEELNAVYL